jgi:hypothetical protein
MGTIFGYHVSNTAMTFVLLIGYGVFCLLVVGFVVRVVSEIFDGLSGKK